MKRIFLVCIALLLFVSGSAQQALVLVRDSAVATTLMQKGFVVNARVGNIISVQWKGNRIDELNNIVGVLCAETGENVLPAARLDSLSLAVTKVSLLHNNYTAYGFPQAVTGKGVIVGIVDVGFQLNHPNFLDRAGQKNRVVRFWNQTLNAGTPPQGYSYGSLFTDVTKITHQDYSGTHGTHVTGIAAGSGYGTPGHNQSGVAYDADIVMVQIKYSNETIPSGARGDYLVANPSIIDAFDYIFKYADSVGKPAVINLSWGMHTGPHDGTSLFDKALDGLVGKGKIIVGAAGNERGHNMHLEHQFSNDTVATWAAENITRTDPFESLYVDFWGSASSAFSLQALVFDTLGVLVDSTPFVSSVSNDTVINSIMGNDTFFCSFACLASSPLNNKPNILFNAWHNHPVNRYVVIRATSANTRLHAWNSGGVDRWVPGGFGDRFKGQQPYGYMLKGDNNTTTGENGGTANGVITVGAYATSWTWLDAWGNFRPTFGLPGALANFSSGGPTVDGRTKPDIVAPGLAVSSSINKYTPLDLTILSQVSIINSDTNYYGILGGTSMAAPQVAGITALMLQLNPNLTNVQVRDILRSTAVKDSMTGNVPNFLYGWGKADALAALQQVKGISAIQLPDATTMQMYPNPVTNRVTISWADAGTEITGYKVYTMDGRVIKDEKILHTVNESISFEAETWPAGMYFVQLETDRGTLSGKFIKR